MDDEPTPEVTLPELQGIARELAALGDADVPRDVAERLAARLAAERATTPLGAARRRRGRGLRVASLAAGVAAASVIAVLVVSQLTGGDGTPSARPPAVPAAAMEVSGAADSSGGSTLAKTAVTPAACKKLKPKPPCRTKRCRIVRKTARKARHRACQRARGASAPGG